MRVCTFVVGVAVACLWSAPARAQIAVYGQATGATLQFAGTAHMYGATFGGYDTKRVGPLAMGADFRGAMIKRGGSQGQYTDQALDMGQFGVRVAAGPHVLPLSLMPYAEALVGIGYWRGGLATLRQDKTHALMQLVAGVDCTITRRAEWRIVEFTYGRAGAQPGFINPETLSTGIVLRLP